MRNCRAVVIGCSSGGLNALNVILSALPEDFPVPIAVVQHMGADSPGVLASLLSEAAGIPVKEAEDKEPLSPGKVYVAPPNYHLLIDEGGMASLSVDEKENHSRPSIDVLFESAADVYGDGLIGVVLTGANSDGASGLRRIGDRGGVTIVQDPMTAESPEMPSSALRVIKPDHVLPLEKIASFLAGLRSEPGEGGR